MAISTIKLSVNTPIDITAIATTAAGSDVDGETSDNIDMISLYQSSSQATNVIFDNTLGSDINILIEGNEVGVCCSQVAKVADFTYTIPAGKVIIMNISGAHADDGVATITYPNDDATSSSLKIGAFVGYAC